MTRRGIVRTPPPFARGDAVEVTEPHGARWQGVVGAVKFSTVTGWWIEVDRPDETWSVPAGNVREVRP